MQMTKLHNQTQTQLYHAAKRLIPSFSNPAHKGSHGKIGIMGGCFEYTGAPFYAAAASLYTGADLTFIFCTPEAATPIKTYSPAHIVLPYLPGNDTEYNDSMHYSMDKMNPWLDRLDVLVIGPGLGRAKQTLRFAEDVIVHAQNRKLPLILDGDALYLLHQNPSILTSSLAILTPNKVEFERLWNAQKDSNSTEQKEIPKSSRHAVVELSSRYAGATIIRKGEHDTIGHAFQNDTLTGQAIVSQVEGSPRRCGGQGDILCGTIATFVAWNNRKHDDDETNMQKHLDACAYAGSALLRNAAISAFRKHGRATTTEAILQHLGENFSSLFDHV